MLLSLGDESVSLVTRFERSMYRKEEGSVRCTGAQVAEAYESMGQLGRLDGIEIGERL